jgi:cellulose 1,4-beta-cellobiosidase
MTQKSLAPMAGATIVSNEDGTPENLMISPATGLIIKNGNTGGLAVSLPCKPTQNVTVKTTVIDGSGKLTVSAGASLTFTSGNWNTPQGITLQSTAAEAGYFSVLVAPFHSEIPGYGAVTTNVLVS